MTKSGQHKSNNWYLFIAGFCFCSGILIPVGVLVSVMYFWGKLFGEPAKINEYDDEITRQYA